MSIITNNINRDNLSSLNEVKAGETGYGLLIERDNNMLDDCDIVKQIKEDIEHHHKFVIPDEFIVSAVFQKYDIKNANGRIYPEAILKREVQKYIEQRVPKLSYGSLDHPNSSSLSGHDVTHRILNLEWKGRTLIGEMILNVTEGFRKYGVCSTSGDLAAQLIVNGGMIGVSSRAVGSVEERFGSLIVGDDLELVSWDVVLEPSTPNAYIGLSREELTPFIESKEASDKAKLNEKINSINKIILT